MGPAHGVSALQAICISVLACGQLWIFIFVYLFQRFIGFFFKFGVALKGCGCMIVTGFGRNHFFVRIHIQILIDGWSDGVGRDIQKLYMFTQMMIDGLQ